MNDLIHSILPRGIRLFFLHLIYIHDYIQN